MTNIAEDINKFSEIEDANLNKLGKVEKEIYSEKEITFLKISHDEHSKWHKIMDRHIDLTFCLLQVKEQMKSLTKSQGFPTKKFLDNLSNEISELNIGFHEAHAQVDLLTEG